MEGYLRVNLLGPGPRLIKKEFTGPRFHRGWETPSYTMGTVSFPGVKRPGLGVDHPPPLEPWLRMAWSYTSAVPLFQAVFFSGGGYYPPPRLSQTPRLPVPRQVYSYVYKGNANTYLISNFYSLEAAPSDVPPSLPRPKYAPATTTTTTTTTAAASSSSSSSAANTAVFSMLRDLCSLSGWVNNQKVRKFFDDRSRCLAGILTHMI